ncbi:MAG: phosphatase PAP2 family protein [Clostridia bacterium]|nr:phosphatase PAP2 family protein [Clostridia bacterium]
MSNIEFAILDFIQNYIRNPLFDKAMVFITTLGNSGMIWIVIALLMLCSKKYRTTGLMLSVGLIGSFFFGNLILKPLFHRTRPFDIADGINLLISAPRDYSFPSGHTLASVISATVLLIRERKIGFFALALAILIAFSRLYLYVHFPTDILGGVIVGIIIGVLSVKTVKKIMRI